MSCRVNGRRQCQAGQRLGSSHRPTGFVWSGQHVHSPTKTNGGILDIVVTRTDDSPRSLYVEEVGLSDHSLVGWSLAMRRSTTPTNVTSERLIWKDFDLPSFSTQLFNSVLCTSDLSNTDLDGDAMAAQYTTTIIDGLVPVTKTTCRVRQSDPWYDNDCRFAKRAAKKLERQYIAQCARRQEHHRRFHTKRRGSTHSVPLISLSSRNDEYSGGPKCPAQPTHDNCGGR